MGYISLLQNEDETPATGMEKVEAPPGFVEWELVDSQAGLIRRRQRYKGILRNR